MNVAVVVVARIAMMNVVVVDRGGDAAIGPGPLLGQEYHRVGKNVASGVRPVTSGPRRGAVVGRWTMS